jgi:hypothetical protein
MSMVAGAKQARQCQNTYPLREFSDNPAEIVAFRLQRLHAAGGKSPRAQFRAHCALAQLRMRAIEIIEARRDVSGKFVANRKSQAHRTSVETDDAEPTSSGLRPKTEPELRRHDRLAANDYDATIA